MVAELLVIVSLWCFCTNEINDDDDDDDDDDIDNNLLRKITHTQSLAFM